MKKIIISLILFVIPIGLASAKPISLNYKETIEKEIELFDNDEKYFENISNLKKIDLDNYEFDSNKIVIYLFIDNSLENSLDSIEFISTLYENYNKKIDIVSFEISENNDNKILLNNLIKKLDIEDEKVPFAVIGNDCFYEFNNESKDKIVSLIEDYNSDNYKDIVNVVLDELNNQSIKSLNFKETIEEEINVFKNSTNYENEINILNNFNFDEYKEYDDKIKVYIFRGDTCGYCLKSIAFFSELYETIGDKYDLVSYEVWHNGSNYELLNKVVSELNIELEGVPFIIIGEKYFNGYDKDFNDEIINIINDYDNHKENYIDVVKEIMSGTYKKDENKDILSKKNNPLFDKIKEFIRDKFDNNTVLSYSILLILVVIVVLLIL